MTSSSFYYAKAFAPPTTISQQMTVTSRRAADMQAPAVVTATTLFVTREERKLRDKLRKTEDKVKRLERRLSSLESRQRKIERNVIGGNPIKGFFDDLFTWSAIILAFIYILGITAEN